MFEGEGCLRLRRTKWQMANGIESIGYTLGATICSTDAGALDALYEEIGGAIYYFERGGVRFPRYDWVVTQYGAEVLIRQMLPYLHYPRKIIEAKLGLLFGPLCHPGLDGRKRRPEATTMMERFHAAFIGLHKKSRVDQQGRAELRSFLSEVGPGLLPLLDRAEGRPHLRPVSD